MLILFFVNKVTFLIKFSCAHELLVLCSQDKKTNNKKKKRPCCFCVLILLQYIFTKSFFFPHLVKKWNALDDSAVKLFTDKIHSTSPLKGYLPAALHHGSSVCLGVFCSCTAAPSCQTGGRSVLWNSIYRVIWPILATHHQSFLCTLAIFIRNEV